MLNQLHTKDQSDSEWASQAVDDLIAGINLNRRLVDDGVWDQYISNMTEDFELAAYGTFLIGLRESLSVAKRARDSVQKTAK